MFTNQVCVIGIPVPVENQVLLVDPLERVSGHIVEPVLGKKSADAAGLGAKFNRSPISQPDCLREADFRESCWL